MSYSTRAFVGLAAMLWTCTPYKLPPGSGGALPQRVSELGLYADLRAGTVVDDVRAYRPTFALWSDGAQKRRWIRLPAGHTIDTADMNAWRFPVGTELWKEFSLGGKRVETRVLRKIGIEDSSWAAMSYAWNQEQNDAIAAPDGVVEALGTKYDIPSAGTCMACHGGRPGRILGFSAIQLAHDAEHVGELTLERLAAEKRLSAAPAHAIQMPGPREDAAAIGYLHANCGHCHNGSRPPDATYFKPPATIDFGLRVEDLGSVTATTAYTTAARFTMGENPAENHLIVQRMTHEGGYMRRMPPLATKSADPEGVDLVTRWLERVAGAKK